MEHQHREQEFAAKFLSQEISEQVRHEPSEWAANAWHILYRNLKQEYGPLAADAGPVALVVYAECFELAMKYLGNHPAIPRFRLLHTLVSSHRAQLRFFLIHMDEKNFFPHEKRMVDESVVRIDRCFDLLKQYCPDTT